MTYEIVPAHLAVQAMRDNGYKNAAYAVAELIDNSIQARATLVELLCAERVTIVDQRQRSRIHQVAVLDNGCGMDSDLLKAALQFGNGSHLNPDQQQGMGKFGMGLPSASISQCKRVEVWSWQAGIESALYTYIDVDEIKSRKQTSIPEPKVTPIPSMWIQSGEGFSASGTLIVWSNLDRIMWRTARAIIENSEFLVGRMYRRFLALGQAKIRMVAFDADSPESIASSEEARPNDPGYLMEATSCPPPFDNVAMFEPFPSIENNQVEHKVRFNGEEHTVTTRFSMAKNEARQLGGVTPGATPHGKHAGRNVGISIVRAGRELDLDQAFVIKYNPAERWWGIEVDFPPALDDLFGVTNNKQAARNFADLSQIEFTTAALEEMRLDEDPRVPLIEIAKRIHVNIAEMRKWLRNQTEGTRQKQQRYDNPSPETIATNATRERQEEGFIGTSDRDEQLPPEQREAAIQQTLVDAGIPEDAAKELAATTISDGLKYVFSVAELESSAFFSVKSRGGAIIITLNTSHPAYVHLVEVLEGDNSVDVGTLQARLSRASDGLRLLLSAWARYEDEQPEGAPRTRVQETRMDWGRIAHRFLEREQ